MAFSCRRSCARVPWLGVVLCALALRLIVATQVYGTNDLDTWRHLASTVADHGLPESYQHEQLLNHPPLAILWALGAWKIHEAGWGDFVLLIKLPAMLADALACWLLWRLPNGRALAWIYALSPLAIGISAYHGNTDSVYAVLLLASALQADRGESRRAGMLMGLAMNVKVIPILLLPALLLTRRSWREVRQLALGFVLGVMPLVLGAGVVGPVLFHKLFGYGSNLEQWGIPLILSSMGQWLGDPGRWQGWVTQYHAHLGRWIMLGAIALASIDALHRPQRATWAMAMAAGLFVVLAPGFGVQYLSLPCLLLLAARPRWGFYAQLSAGVFVWMVYLQFMNHSAYPKSTFCTPIQSPAQWVGLCAWLILVLPLAHTLIPRRSPEPVGEPALV